ncbi:MAG: glycosyltransferase family 9 protein [Candidatus Wallbacteria bacterium]|nr:glycosyltransferase family 9 protein [Candidatus Wallbacteria bacterium]
MIEPKIALIFPYPGIGDFIMTTPFFRQLKILHRNTQFHLLLREDARFRELAENQDFASVGYFKRKFTAREFFRFAAKLRGQKFTHIYTFREGLKYKLLTLLCARPSHAMGRGFLWVRGHRFDSHAHFASRFFLTDPVKSISAENLGDNYELKIPEKFRRSAEEYLGRKGIRPDRLILLNPGAWEKSKRWSLTNFIVLAQYYREQGFCPVFTLGPFERELEKTLLEGNFEIFRSESLCTLAALIGHSRAFITNDTGPMHIACCMPVTLAAVISRRACLTVRPLKPGAVILSSSPDCALECETCDQNCLDQVKPAQLIEKLKSCLL